MQRYQRAYARQALAGALMLLDMCFFGAIAEPVGCGKDGGRRVGKRLAFPAFRTAPTASALLSLRIFRHLLLPPQRFDFKAMELLGYSQDTSRGREDSAEEPLFPQIMLPVP